MTAITISIHDRHHGGSEVFQDAVGYAVRILGLARSTSLKLCQIRLQSQQAMQLGLETGKSREVESEG